jgi:hypothetical protein
MYASPLAVIAKVVRTKSTEFMPLALSAATLFCSLCWATYGCAQHLVQWYSMLQHRTTCKKSERRKVSVAHKDSHMCSLVHLHARRPWQLPRGRPERPRAKRSRCAPRRRPGPHVRLLLPAHKHCTSEAHPDSFLPSRRRSLQMLLLASIGADRAARSPHRADVV